MRGPLPARYALLEGAFRNGDYQGAYGAVGNWAACHPVASGIKWAFTSRERTLAAH